MTEPLPPTVRGALISDRAAYVLSLVLDRDEIAERIDQRGFGEPWREAALLAVEAISIEGAAWRRAAEARLEKARSASGTRAVPESKDPAWSVAMKSDMTVSAAAAELGCSRSYVRRLARSGRLGGRRDGRDWRLDTAAVAELAAARANDKEER